MTQETFDEVECARTDAHDGASRLAALHALPQPLHLLESSVGTQHYHFGHFALFGDSLRAAQDRMSLWGLRHFARGSAVLDIGCGLGGTSRLLAGSGLEVTALEPCREALRYARARGEDEGTTGAPCFVEQTLEGFARTSGARFDGALALEVLQHFPDLAAFFGCCRRLLRPGGALVLHYVSVHLEIEFERVPFHPRARVLAAGEAAGFARLDGHDLTPAILPTLPRLRRALELRRPELVAAFGGERPVERELDDLVSHMAALQQAFELAQLSYETLALRAPGAS